MYLCAKVINFASFYDFTVRFWNCSDSVVFFGTVPTVWYFLELFRQCGICWNCSDSVVFFAFHVISDEKGHKHCIRPSLYFCVGGTS
jgi:hypothetical protein